MLIRSFSRLDVDETGAGGLSRGADAAHVEHVQRVAADGRRLGHDDLFGLRLHDLLDDGRHQLGAGVDGGRGGGGVAGVGLQHHGAPRFDQVLHAAQEGEDLGYHLLGIGTFGYGDY